MDGRCHSLKREVNSLVARDKPKWDISEIKKQSDGRSLEFYHLGFFVPDFRELKYLKKAGTI